MDIGDTWLIMPSNGSPLVAGTNNVTYRLDGNPLPAGWLPVGSHLAVLLATNFHYGGSSVDAERSGLAIQVVHDAGYTAYGKRAAARGFPTNQLSFPYQDANADGILNGMEYLFGTNAAGGITPAQLRRVAGEHGRTYFELSYARPAGHPHAIYYPYFSADGTNWYAADMAVTGISPGPGPNQETVTLRSEFPDEGQQLFFRIQADFVPDNNIDASLLPEKPLFGFDSLGAYEGRPHIDQIIADHGYNVSYRVGPGQVLFFHISGEPLENGASALGTGIYKDTSNPLALVAFHAGALPYYYQGEKQQSGPIKVTFLPGQQEYIGSITNGWRTYGETNQTAYERLSFRPERNPGPFVLDAVEVPSPTILNPRVSGNNFCFSWTSVPTVHYYVQGVTALNSTNWLALTPTIVATTNTTAWCLPLPSPFHFFRVVQGEATTLYVPPPVITNILRTNNAVFIQWSGPTNAQYHVQWKPTLAVGWNTFSNLIVSPSGAFSFLDNGTQTGGLGATRFYQLRQLP